MPPPSTCFLSTQALHHRTNRTQLTLYRSNPLVCVLDERPVPSSVETITHRCQPALLAIQPNVRPHNYQVLPCNESSLELPKPPIHYAVPFIGYLLELMFRPNLRIKRARQFDGVYTSNGFLRRTHFVTDYNAITAMLKDTESFLNRGAIVGAPEMFGEDNLSNLDGICHKRMRAQMAPSFSPLLMPYYFEVIHRLSAEGWVGLANSTAKGTTAYLDSYFRDLFLANIIELTTGLTYESAHYAMIRNRFETMIYAFIMPKFVPQYKEAMQAKDELYEVVVQVLGDALVENAEEIERVRQYGDKISALASKEFPRRKVNFLIMHIAASQLKTGTAVSENNPEDVRKVAEKIVGLWFAGYLTNSATSSSAALVLGTRPDVWAALRNEQDALVAAEDGDVEVKFDQLSQMPLLDSFFQEVLRMYPISMGVHRIVGRDVEVFGHRLAKDDVVFFEFISAHFDDRYYKQPELFKLDRFVKRDDVPPAPRILTFTPKGNAHYCIGAQLATTMLKSIFSDLLRKYTLEMDPTQSFEWSYFPETLPESKVAVTRVHRRKPHE